MDYQSNSKSKPDPEKKEVKKVIEGEAIQRKKPIGKRFKEIFIGGDVHSVSRYLAAEVLFPAVRNMIFDATNKGMERILFGENAPRRRPPQYGAKMTYHSGVRRDPRESRDFRPPDQGPRPLPQRSDSTEYLMSTRADAEKVLEQLIEIVDQYEVASVADLHELAGLEFSHIDHKWGWTYLGNSGIRQVREGFIIELPPTQPLG